MPEMAEGGLIARFSGHACKGTTKLRPRRHFFAIFREGKNWRAECTEEKEEGRLELRWSPTPPGHRKGGSRSRWCGVGRLRVGPRLSRDGLSSTYLCQKLFKWTTSSRTQQRRHDPQTPSPARPTTIAQRHGETPLQLGRQSEDAAHVLRHAAAARPTATLEASGMAVATGIVGFCQHGRTRHEP